MPNSKPNSLNEYVTIFSAYHRLSQKIIMNTFKNNRKKTIFTI
jgi:hypothetical protein